MAELASTGHVDRPTIACLLPARNAAAHLPEWLRRAGTFCDAVVALDDGSTDDTGEILAAHQLVKVLLRNPRRSSAPGWHDGGDRNRLLEAAADLDPKWVLFLDADERIDASDAAALRAFVDTDALPGCAYSLRQFRMIGAHGYDPDFEPVARLFAFLPGQRVPDEASVAEPVPGALPRIETTLRIQHLAELDNAARGPLPRWEPRPPDLAVLPSSAGAIEVGGPLVSAVVIATDEIDTPDEATVQSLLDQASIEPVEVVIVVTGAGIAARLSRVFPQLRLIECDVRASRGAARNAGLAEAQGDYVLFVEAPGEVPLTTAATLLYAHERGYVMVTGEVTAVAATSPWERAGYFLDHAASLPRGLTGEIDVAPGWCSYAREPLLMLGGFPDLAAPDPVVAEELLRRGCSVWRDPDLRVHVGVLARSGRELLRERVRQGRALGRMAVGSRIGTADGSLGRWALRHGWRRLTAVRRHALHADPQAAEEFRQTAPLVAVGELGSWVGLGFEVARDLAPTIV